MSWSSSFAASLPAPCATASVSAAPRTTSSQTPSTVRRCPRLLLDSSVAPRKANATSPASPVNTPPCPSCPSAFRMSSSQSAAAASFSAGVLGVAMLSAIQQLTNGCYCQITSVLVARLAWGSIQQSPRTSMCLNMER
jgi:hypothetical protein